MGSDARRGRERAQDGFRANLGLLASSLPGKAMLAIMGLWIVLAISVPTHDAQDAIPMVVAGDLAASNPDSIYNGASSSLYDLNPKFRERTCGFYRSIDECTERGVAFLSPPTALPVVFTVALLPDRMAVTAFNLLAAAATAASFVIVWGRLAGRGETVQWLIASTAIVVTPQLVEAIELGQTSPLLYLAAGLGLAWADRPRVRAVAAVVLALCIAFKAAPAVLLGLLVLERRWRWFAVTVGLLVTGTVLALGVGGFDLLGDFVRSTSAVDEQSVANPYNSAFETVIFRSLDLTSSADVARMASIGLRLLVVVVVVSIVRRSHSDVRWVAAWTTLIVILPLTWSHYRLVGLIGIGVAVAAVHAGDRWLWAMGGLGVLTVPLAFIDTTATVMPLLREGWMLACLVVVLMLARSTTPPRKPEPASHRPTRV